MNEQVRFDAYSATAVGWKHEEAVAWLWCARDTLDQGKGYHTFAERVSVKDETGSEVGSVSWGGRQGDRIMVEVKGHRTPGVVERIRQAGEHRCTRVDSCVDVERPGAFEELLEPVMRVKQEFGLYGERRGDWEFPELGRTQYLGANSSAIRARLYEKGKQPEYRYLGRPDLARLEIQVRPAKEAKTVYAGLSALEVWGASKWTRELAADVLAQMLDAHPPGTVRKLTTEYAKLRWLCRQYGATLVSLKNDLGSWECVGLTIREVMDELKREKGGH